MMKRSEIVNKLPASPGVYIMKDREKRVIYVGKAKSLKDRVKYYFMDRDTVKNRLLVSNSEELEYITTGNEVEALVLESNLIKEHRPRYNVKLRDDKNYPFIRITNEEFPRICIARRRIMDGSEYFGPYPSAKAVREMIKMASRFGIRRCKKKLPCAPCLNYHIGQCAAPCSGSIGHDEYQNIVEKGRSFLKGKQHQLIHSLRNEMDNLSTSQDYEKAARIRDQINALLELSTRQRVNLPGKKEQDIIACEISENTGSVQIFHVSEGVLKGRETFYLDTAGSSDIESISSFIKQYYQDFEPPSEIIIPVELMDNSISNWLMEKGSKLKVPRSKVEKGLMDLARENAKMLLDQELISKRSSDNKALIDLKDALGIAVIPVLIEAFDISNISGTSAAGSLVAFENGMPSKDKYRRFRVKTVTGSDDFAMMGEVVKRAYSRRIIEGKPMPDLVLIDGGKGQLNAALSAISALGLNLNVAALAKEFEYIFLPDREEPVILPKGSPSLLLMQRIRDEAHRFALAYHRKLRAKSIKT